MPQDILITPYKDSTSSGAKIEFTGLNSGASTITMRVLSDSTLSYEGTAGQLFSISNGLSSGTIFSVMIFLVFLALMLLLVDWLD